ncbi:MAG TPA: FAD-binding protein [Terriglobia bacterium]|nr:FAD-binding protein [Terriglobia bacterium]
MSWIAELTSLIAGQVLTDDDARAEVSTDFGRVVERKPAAVVRPASARDIAATVKFAGRHSLLISARGCGHSQNGLSLSDQIVLDLRGLDRILSVNETRGQVTCQAGATWRALVNKLLPPGLSPPVLTNNLDVTLGGTLSTAGLGVASWRRGTQADHCLALEVVTGDGEIVQCAEGSELFDAVRGGLGRFGVITEATLELRRHKPRFRSFDLLYDDLDALLGDLKTLMNDERFDYLESWCVPLPQGLKKVDGQRQPFAQWFFPLHCTVEVEEMSALSASSTQEKLAGLHYYKHSHTEDGEIGEFFSRLDPLFHLWKTGGFWDCAHPWMECILPWSACALYIRQMTAQMQPQFLTGGHILLWPARGGAASVPYFCRPDEDYVMGLGILPAVPKHLLDRALPRLKQASQAATMLGGKRYLSGWLDFNAADWKTHFGGHWEKINELKQKYDPAGILGGFD